MQSLVKRLPWQCAAVEVHHVVAVAQWAGWRDDLHLSAGSLQVAQRGLSVGGAACQDGPALLRRQHVGGAPRHDGLWLAGTQGVVTCYKVIRTAL